MKNKTFKYILFVFAKSKNQDDFVTEIAEECKVSAMTIQRALDKFGLIKKR